MTTLPEVRVGEPIRHEALTVFPLFSPPDGAVEYLLSDEAIGAGSVTVEEVSEGGSVPNLLVSNTGDSRVLFLEGEELQGGEAEPGAEHLGAGRRPEQDADPGQLRRARAVAIPDQALLLGRVAFVLEAAAAPQGVGRPVAQGRARAHVGPGGRLEGGRPPDGLARLHVRDGGDVGHLRAPPGPPGRVPGAVEVRRGGERGRRRRGAAGRRRGRVRQALDLPEGLGPAAERRGHGRPGGGQAGEGRRGRRRGGPPARLRAAAWEPAPAVGEGQEYRSDSVPSAHASSLALGDSVLHGSVVVES